MQDKLRIAILGARGIPNSYGGFEQSAEDLSVHFVKRGHEVTVYNPDYHPYKEKEWNGVRIKHVFSREGRLGAIGNFIYDYFCLKDAVGGNYEIVLEMGYAPSALFFDLKKKIKAKLITNMDGFDWRRSKWSATQRKIIKYCEKLAVEKSDALISDNPGIRDYLLKEHNKDSFCIPYGAELFNEPKKEYLEEYGLEKYRYYMLVARIEPENNIEVILDGYMLSGAKELFIVIGNYNTKFGKYLAKKYKDIERVRFLGGIYNYEALSSLRWYTKLHFHGHSVGGTNPSLLEAMASNAYIVAHDNPFNRYVSGDDAFYFSTARDIAYVIKNYTDEFRDVFIKNNRDKIETIYNWDRVSEEYLRVFKEVLKK